MKNLKPVLWIVLGVLVGASGTTAIRAAVPQTQRRLDVRTISGDAVGSGLNQWAHWIKDTKTGACWLALGRNPGEAVGLAPGPKEACD